MQSRVKLGALVTEYTLAGVQMILNTLQNNSYEETGGWGVSEGGRDKTRAWKGGWVQIKEIKEIAKYGNENSEVWK